MYPTLSQAVTLLTEVQHGLELRDGQEVGPRVDPEVGPGVSPDLPTVIVCPPFPCLPVLAELLDRRFVRLGAQNCHWEPAGPYTGEVSPAMLAEWADYVLVGHSDRRTVGETDEQIARKVRAAVAAGLTPVLFVGEDEPTDAAAGHTERRLIRGLAEVDPSEHAVLVVYEPTWAIGAAAPADTGHVRQVVGVLKARLRALGACRGDILYGGTVNADNVGQFTGIDPLDGVGATRGTLDAQGFLRIVDQVRRP